MKSGSFIPKRKLSSAVIMGVDVRQIWRIEFKANPNLERVALYRIAGKAVRWETKDTVHGESICLIGDFVAVCSKTTAFSNEGTVFKSNRCYLPNIMTDSVLAHMTDGKYVEFAFDVAIVPDPDVRSTTGYTYTFDTLIEVAQDQDLQRLQTAIGVTEQKVIEGNTQEANKQKKLALAK